MAEKTGSCNDQQSAGALQEGKVFFIGTVGDVHQHGMQFLSQNDLAYSVYISKDCVSSRFFGVFLYRRRGQDGPVASAGFGGVQGVVGGAQERIDVGLSRVPDGHPGADRGGNG